MQDTQDTPSAPAGAPAEQILDAIEARIIGCLIEKAATTPDAYPLTENALVLACNQKTNREPTMQLEPGAVAHALRVLETRHLVKVASSSQRALRYEHRFENAWQTTARQRAVLCVMLLRGPQTLAELHTRTDRLADFPALDDVRDTVDRLIQREPPLVVRIARSHGQREDRYMHLLSGPVDPGVAAMEPPPRRTPTASCDDLDGRLERIETVVEDLRAELAELRRRLEGS